MSGETYETSDQLEIVSANSNGCDEREIVRCDFLEQLCHTLKNSQIEQVQEKDEIHESKMNSECSSNMHIAPEIVSSTKISSNRPV